MSEERQVIVLYFLTDMLIFCLALTLASWVRVVPLTVEDILPLQRDRALCLGIFGMAALATGCYRSSRILSRFDSIYYILVALTIALAAEFALASVFLPPQRIISRRELMLSAGLSVMFLAVWHYLAASLIARFGSLRGFFYVLGTGDQSKHILEAITQNWSVEAHAESGTLDDLVRRIEQLNDKKEVGPRVSIDVIITEDGREGDEKVPYKVLAVCEKHCRRTFLYPSLDDTLLFQHTGLLAIAGVPLVEITSQSKRSIYPYVKRGMDIVISATGLLLSLPICVVTAAVIKVSSRGSVFYTQERVTLGGKPFKIYKFRSMRADIELKDEHGHVLAKEDDARITPVGRFLRRHRIDEIPQFFNVLKGDMSLIGPRPVWKEFYDSQHDEIPLFERRLAIRPGLASLSHVLGSYSSKPEDRLRYDLVYISTLSFAVDLKIMLETARIVLSGKGSA